MARTTPIGRYGNIRIMDGAGINAGIFNGIAFQPRGAYLTVDYQLGGEAEVNKDFGPDSGAELCKDDSPWVVQYSAVDVAGNVGTCADPGRLWLRRGSDVRRLCETND